MVVSENHAPLSWRWSLLASAAGVAAALMLAVGTGLDTRLVQAFRGGRTIPYRTVFFVILASICALSSRRSNPGRDARMLLKMAAAGVSAGYFAGLLASFFVSYVFISASGAWKSLMSGVDGVFVAIAVPLVTFSWLFGFVAYAAAFALRVVTRRI